MNKTTKRDTLGNIRHYAPFALTLLAALMYFSHPSRLNEAKNVWHRFYRIAPRQGITLDAWSTINAFESGEFSPWSNRIARAIWIRYRNKDSFPNSVARLVDRWRQGLWECPPVDVWNGAMEEFERQWKERAARAGESKTTWTIDQPDQDSARGDSISVTLTPTAGDTALVGDTLVVCLENDAEAPLPDLTLYWTTKRFGIRPDQRIVGQVEVENDCILATFDLSMEPRWLAPGAESAPMRLDIYRPGGAPNISEIWGEHRWE